MKSNELRIGNYVFEDNGELIQIEDGLDIDASGQFNPVPLTEEWLIKFGFSIVKTTSAYGFDCNKNCESKKYVLRGAWNGKNWFSYEILNNGTHKKFEFVHQLQNLFFVLTVEELTIK